MKCRQSTKRLTNRFLLDARARSDEPVEDGAHPCGEADDFPVDRRSYTHVWAGAPGRERTTGLHLP